jgi:phospholipase C
MSLKGIASRASKYLRIGFTSMVLFQFTVGGPLATTVQAADKDDDKTTSPIKHVIVIIGENRTFDHVFATYVPKNGQTIHNLLSEGIVNADGTPGPNFKKAQQLAATDSAPDNFLLNPPKQEFPNNQLPTPLVGGAFDSYIPGDSLTLAKQTELGLPDSYLPYLVSGGTGLSSHTPDTRITNVTSLPAGPFQLTGPTFDYNAYAASPVHRFYQMWQQENCSVEHFTFENPSGCNAKLFSWVEVTVGAGTNGSAQPPLCSADGDTTPCFTTNYLPSVPKAKTTGEGSTALGFYNVLQGDAPYFKHLADTYAMSDNFHQSVDGGTGANHIMFGHGDAIWFSDGNGNPAVPPHNVDVDTANPSETGVVDEVENPNPAPGTNNWYIEDGYGSGGFEYGDTNPAPPPLYLNAPVSGGGSYSDCSDLSQPGVAEIVHYLQSLPRPIDPHCEKGHYYLLNNYNPGYFGDGSNAFTDTNEANTPFTIPPSSTRSIGDVLIDHHVSWKYYGDQWNNYAGYGTPGTPGYIAPDPYQLNYGSVGSPNYWDGSPIVNADEYCNICNPFQYDTSIMANAAVRTKHIQDLANLYSDIENGTLPAVSITKPSGFVDGHPSSSKLNLFEGYVKKIVDKVANSAYADDTAIFITFDEGGGYYDSGYVQPLDFFGDGTRIPFLVVSKYSKGGRVAHNYSDHVSILKFIERNWNLPPVTKRSRDNFPNPFALPVNPYVPLNTPAISDLFELFDFGGKN